MGKNAGSHVLRASMVSLVIDRFPLIIFNYLLCSFFLFFSFKVTDNVIRLTAVVLASRVTWEYDARSLALKVFNYLACLMDRWRHLIYISYTLSLLLFVRHIWRRMSTEMQSMQKWRRVSSRHWSVFINAHVKCK